MPAPRFLATSASFCAGRETLSAALTEEQRAILEKRGVLSPNEIHRLASKTREQMGAAPGEKAACHSDVATDEQAAELQAD